MKILAKILGFITLFYILCWVALAVYFGFAERHKGLIEENLTGLFGRPVTIEKLETKWLDWEPSLRIQNLHVAGDDPTEAALSFESASVVVSPVSLFTFWPRFTEFAVERPSLEVVTLPNNKLQIAGITLGKSSRRGVDRIRLLSWLLNQESAAWHNGDIRWRKSDGTVQRYTDISFVYERSQQSRNAKATIKAPKGTVTVNALAQGDLLSSKDWDAQIDLLSGVTGRMLEPGDLSFQVKNGHGQFRLARLNVERIREFLALSGLADKARWILDADVSGLLHDVEFTFDGALTNIQDWSLRASATDVDFKSLDSLPALTNLNGELSVNKTSGSFKFTAVNSEFEWTKLYESSFPIESAQGDFSWRRNDLGEFEISLEGGKLIDPALSIYDINASMVFDRAQQEVDSLGQLFTVESIENLSYQDGAVIDTGGTSTPEPLSLIANARFEVEDTSKLVAYLPKIKKLQSFRSWLEVAFQQGRLQEGRASYRGELTPTAIKDGGAQLVVSADFDSAKIDYAPKFDWPPAERGKGVARLENDFLTINPSELWLNGDEVTDATLTIERIFSRDILLKLHGKTSTTLDKGMKFLFQGPLIPVKDRPDVLPVEPIAGQVDIEVELDLPISDISNLAVRGKSKVKNGQLILPEGVPLTLLNGSVNFTERTVSSDDITASFLGGPVAATLITTAQTQPPKMQLRGKGQAFLSELTPWVGEHLLTLFKGQADWQGTLDINGGNLQINGGSDLIGIEVDAPEPLRKPAENPASFSLSMNLGGKTVEGDEPAQRMTVEYASLMKAEFQANKKQTPDQSTSLFDRALIQLGEIENLPLPQGVNFRIDHPTLDLDALLDSVIDLASYEPILKTQNTDFLDAMRTVTLRTEAAKSMGRPFGAFRASMVTKDGLSWNGELSGDNVLGTMELSPRSEIGRYSLSLQKLVIGPYGSERPKVEPIDPSLQPKEYPAIDITIDNLRMDGRSMGALNFIGRPIGTEWTIDKFTLVHNGIRTSAAGKWVNSVATDSVSLFDFSTTIDEAEGALTEMDFDGYIRKGRGSVGGTVSWRGAPHEFDYSRLDGTYDLFLKDGELVQVAPGGGKLLGLLNFNAIARRLVFDFRDVFASGLQFDRMRYRGIISNGEAILQDAFILTPAVFVRMEGKLDLYNELIDMDVHISPELGGNLTLLSALANPTAGAVVFLTSQIFKDDMRRSSFKSYQAKGTWEDFEMVEINSEGMPIKSKDKKGDEPEVQQSSQLPQ